MLLYVLFGGMIATTWVQIIKAVLLARRRDRPGACWCWRSSTSPSTALYAAVAARYGAAGARSPAGS